MRSVARRFRVALHTVQRWTVRTQGQRLDRIECEDRPPIPRHIRRTSCRIERTILRFRTKLRDQSALGEFGARAIREELVRLRILPTPAVRTIGRILQRNGALDGRRRIRRPPPPAGWYLPDVASGRAELDSFDIVAGLVIEGGSDVEVFNGVSLHGGLCASWPLPPIGSVRVTEALLEHWGKFGLPAYAQFDNDTRFQGPHQWPGRVGRVIRLCLRLGVVPVFAPPRETGFQAAVESFNGLWQNKVWERFHYNSLPDLQAQSNRYIAAHRDRRASRIDRAPRRRAFPKGGGSPPSRPLRGRIIYLRRTDNQGRVSVLGYRLEVDRLWPHRLVRAEVDLDHDQIHFHALRRRDPQHQPLLRSVKFLLRLTALSR